MIIINIKRTLQKLIRRTDRTEQARRGSGWVGKVAACRGDVRVHVLFTCHARSGCTPSSLVSALHRWVLPFVARFYPFAVGLYLFNVGIYPVIQTLRHWVYPSTLCFTSLSLGFTHLSCRPRGCGGPAYTGVVSPSSQVVL